MSEPARSFQHYEILRREDGSPWELGRGTMGITYKAFDVNLCCEVALKVVNATLLDHPNAKERFVREARAAAALRHRNVASVYHLGNDGERFFYAMEFIDGETLDALVRRQGPLPVETALRVIQQTARALAAAERQQLIHRDIKPANIMVVHEDADDHMVVKVIDFGLARPVACGGTTTGQLTVSGFVGTPQFASPEQLEERPLDARSDIYSLGVTSWFLLTGRAPFAGSLATICQAHLTKSPPWEQLPEWLPGPVRRLLAHMLEKDPARRPQNAVELRRELDECLEAARARPPTATGELSRRASPDIAPQPGTVLQGRYELIRPAGEGPRGRTFEARDANNDGQPVTITFLPAELFTAAAERDRLTDEVRLIQAAAHPHLTQVFAYERTGGKAGFLVEEWVNGGTLADLLAVRGGALSAAEGLRLLGQGAAAADHAAIRRLERLDLGVHQVRLHFLPSGHVTQGTTDPREHLSAAMNDWPAWALKIAPLGTVGEQPELKTWAGEVTLVPGVSSLAGTPGTGQSSPSALATVYLNALAVLIYELLGGNPGVGGKYVSLPALNEGANAVLRQVLSGQSLLKRSRLFYESLARAAGFDPVNLQLATADSPAVRLPTASMARLASTNDPPAPVVRRVSETTSKTFVPARFGSDSTVLRPGQGSTAPFFEQEDAEVYPEGSIADRLTLVSGEPSHMGRWLFGAAALLLVFVLAVGGVWIVLAQRLPRDPGGPGVTNNPDPAKASAHESHHRPSAMPRQAIPPPLPKEPVRMSSPAPTIKPLVAPDIAAESSRPPVTPIATASTVLPETVASTSAPPPVLPSPEKLVSLRVRSIPSGAQIQSEGKSLGITPLEVDLPPGAHELVAHFDGWPETRETVVLSEEQSKALTEIHLMPPGLVPALEVPPPAAQSSRPRRVFPSTPRAQATQSSPTAERRPVPVAPALRVEPPMDDATPPAPPAVTPRPEPEVRRALPPLTPFDPDGTLQSHDTPRPSPSDD